LNDTGFQKEQGMCKKTETWPSGKELIQNVKKKLRNLWEQTVVDICTVAEEMDMHGWRVRQILKTKLNI